MSSVPTVLVTGAAKRLGRQIAVTLSKAGWRVAIHYRSSQEEAEETLALCPGGALFAAELSEEETCMGLVPTVVAQMGRLDAVVNSASTFEPDRPEDFGFSAMERHWRSNTAAPIMLARGLWTHVRERGGEPGSAAVVNLLDQKLWNPNPDFFSYTLSKAALESATSMLALGFAPLVRVVGVAPGLTLPSFSLTGERFEAAHRQSPLKRASTPEDVAATVRFALENRSLTGTTILVDGGQHLLHFERDFSMM